MSKKYDVVVIGAGNGGLAAAVRVLQSGKTCLLLEQHNLPGGFATSFVRGRFEFEASLHELCDFGPKDNPGEIRTLFRELGIEDKIEWVPIHEAFHLVTLDGKYDVTMPFGVDAFIDRMEKHVPGSRPSMEQFFALCEDIQKAQDYVAATDNHADNMVMLKKHGNFLRAGSYTVNEVLRELKLPERARDILNSYWCYLGVDCDKLAFLHYSAMVHRYVTAKAWMPKMKSHEISLAFDTRIRELGGDIWYNSQADKILTDHLGKVSGVTLSDGTIIETKHVVATCSPHLVFGKMLNKRAVDAKTVRATNARKFAGRGYTLYLGLNKSCDELNIQHHNYFIYDTADSAKQYELMKKFETNNVQATVCLNRADPNCSPKGTTMMYFTTMYMTDEWGQIDEKDYFKTKEKIAERMIANFEKATGTKIRDSVEEIAVASPMTYARYCGHPEGVIYGYECQPNDGMITRVMMLDGKEAVDGLRLAGGYGVRASGYSSAYCSGDIAAKQTIADIAAEV